jgi:ribosomal-protein-alanine N-acetyltransferase
VRTSASTVADVALVRFRWWHIESALPIETELFGGEQWSAGMFWSELARGDAVRYAALVADGQLVGYAGIAFDPDVAWIQTMAVRGDRQRRGHGARLLDDLLAAAARRGLRRVGLEVRADNMAAQHLYAGRGFEPVGRRRAYYQPSGTDAVVMLREEAG